MTVRRTLQAVGAALAGAVSAPEAAAPPADPRAVRALLAEIGLLHPRAPESDVPLELCRFQARAGLTVDGIAGPRTVRALVQAAREARHIRSLGLPLAA
ncbi:peptidoglycan-binding protein [Dactylosporangium aurantiacum]|uniref:peptidoglycan-binding protein n=1 Tax=Dactylosporangium aurantiacum TaxID=35754 RepID=UPI000523F726|nr:peptidoglycan-binding domain-containing protein [Dactylosporangium aurantiacum]MDG6107802.1 peptidoglycan-binding domain-containing protein [Dactylosporangium aurantiacum]